MSTVVLVTVGHYPQPRRSWEWAGGSGCIWPRWYCRSWIRRPACYRSVNTKRRGAVRLEPKAASHARRAAEAFHERDGSRKEIVVLKLGETWWLPTRSNTVRPRPIWGGSKRRSRTCARLRGQGPPNSGCGRSTPH